MEMSFVSNIIKVVTISYVILNPIFSITIASSLGLRGMVVALVAINVL
jgi:hypothetical protein